MTIDHTPGLEIHYESTGSGEPVLFIGGTGGARPSYPFHSLPDDLDPVERARMLMGVSDLRFDSKWQIEHPERVEKLLEFVRKGSLPEHETPEARRGARLQLEARAHHDVLGRLGEIDRPTLLCAGRHDGIAPAASQAALLAGIPHAELRWYDGGHMFLLQDRNAWADIITFIGSEPSD